MKLFNKSAKNIATMSLLTILVSGCGGDDIKNPFDSSGSSSDVGEVEVIEVGGVDNMDSSVDGEQIGGEPIDIQETEQFMASESIISDSGTNIDGSPTQRIFFFGYDSSSISDEDLAVIQAHADYLISSSVMIVRLEGHADERGSREYNLSLGERRAQTMSDLLVASGVNLGQIEIISFGEENPLEVGSEESFWAQNRRVELTYPQ